MARATAKTAAKAPVVNCRGMPAAKLLGEAEGEVVPEAADAAAEVAELAEAELELSELSTVVAFLLPHFRLSLQVFCF